MTLDRDAQRLLDHIDVDEPLQLCNQDRSS